MCHTPHISISTCRPGRSPASGGAKWSVVRERSRPRARPQERERVRLEDSLCAVCAVRLGGVARCIAARDHARTSCVHISQGGGLFTNVLPSASPHLISTPFSARAGRGRGDGADLGRTGGEGGDAMAHARTHPHTDTRPLTAGSSPPGPRPYSLSLTAHDPRHAKLHL